MTRLLSILKWSFWFIIFILVLVLILNNWQPVQFNFYGIYSWTIPLIIMIFMAFVLGVLIGVIYGIGRTLELKFRIKLLKKDLEALQKTNHKSESE